MRVELEDHVQAHAFALDVILLKPFAVDRVGLLDGGHQSLVLCSIRSLDQNLKNILARNQVFLALTLTSFFTPPKSVVISNQPILTKSLKRNLVKIQKKNSILSRQYFEMSYSQQHFGWTRDARGAETVGHQIVHLERVGASARRDRARCARGRGNRILRDSRGKRILYLISSLTRRRCT